MNQTLTKQIIILLLLFFFHLSSAQIEVRWFENPSFEEYPRPGITPTGWNNCGIEKFAKESPPDIHPTPNQLFGVKQTPAHKETYLAMVVRENKSWESIGQTLPQPLIGNQCYLFRIKLSQSLTFKSSLTGDTTMVEKDFNDPIVLRIWGGTESCKKTELLAVSPRIDHEDWLNYTFKFTPKDDYKSITLEAYRARGGLIFPNGNILLDDASPIVPISCDMDKTVMANFEWEQYEVLLNDLKSTTDLQWYIASQGYHINFESQTKLSNLEKKKIQNMVKALNEFPKQKLLFYLDGGNKLKDRKRIENIKRQFEIEKLDSRQYDVRNMRSTDYEKGWILKGNGFYVTVEAIK